KRAFLKKNGDITTRRLFYERCPYLFIKDRKGTVYKLDTINSRGHAFGKSLSLGIRKAWFPDKSLCSNIFCFSLWELLPNDNALWRSFAKRIRTYKEVKISTYVSLIIITVFV